MAITDRKLYRFHVANIQSIEIALNNSALSARKAISEENEPAIKSFVSLNAFLVGAWAENRLRKLLYENNGLSVEKREVILSISSQIDRWNKLIEIAFREHYGIPHAPLNKTTLPFSASSRYEILIEILNEDLKGVIEIRNKLAHGQWVYPLNSEETNVEEKKYQLLRNENLPSLQYKKTLLVSLANILHDLVVSLPTFERDFDTNYRKITNTRSNLKNRSYDKYVEQLISKRIKGKLLRTKHNKKIHLIAKIALPFVRRLFLRYIN